MKNALESVINRKRDSREFDYNISVRDMVFSFNSTIEYLPSDWKDAVTIIAYSLQECMGLMLTNQKPDVHFTRLLNYSQNDIMYNVRKLAYSGEAEKKFKNTREIKDITVCEMLLKASNVLEKEPNLSFGDWSLITDITRQYLKDEEGYNRFFKTVENKLFNTVNALNKLKFNDLIKDRKIKKDSRPNLTLSSLWIV